MKTTPREERRKAKNSKVVIFYAFCIIALICVIASNANNIKLFISSLFG